MLLVCLTKTSFYVKTNLKYIWVQTGVIFFQDQLWLDIKSEEFLPSPAGVKQCKIMTTRLIFNSINSNQLNYKNIKIYLLSVV